MAPPISKLNHAVKAAQYQCQWTTVISVIGKVPQAHLSLSSFLEWAFVRRVKRRWVQTALGSECVQLMTIAPHNAAAERLQLIDFPKSEGIKTASGAISREFESLRAPYFPWFFNQFWGL